MAKKALNTKIKELKQYIVGQTTYLGMKEKCPDGFVINNAVEIDDNAGFEATVKKWIKADNINELISTRSEGMVAVDTKEFTPRQMMEIDIIAAKATFEINNALGNLQNGSF